MTRKRDESAAAQAVALYADGQTTRQIAAKLHKDPRTIARWVGDGIRPPGPRPRTSAETDALIIELRTGAAPSSFEAISREVGMSKTGVRMRYYALIGRQRPDRAKAE